MTLFETAETLLRRYGHIALCIGIAMAAAFVLNAHRDHLASSLPYLILLACPLIHIFGHRHHAHAKRPADDSTNSR